MKELCQLRCLERDKFLYALWPFLALNEIAARDSRISIVQELYRTSHF